MPIPFQRPLSAALGALATLALGGCYYGDVNSAGYASSAYACEARYGSGYYDAYDPYAYDDGYGYDCYDGADYGGGFVQIGFGGGWYDDYYYPGYGMWMFDSYRNRYPLRGQYLNYWGGRRAWWMHHRDRPGDGNWNRPGGRPGSGAVRPPTTGNPNWPGHGPGATRPRPSAPGDAAPTRPGRGDPSARPGGWNRGDQGTRPGGWNRGDQNPRPGGWNRGDRDGPRGTRPESSRGDAVTPGRTNGPPPAARPRPAPTGDTARPGPPPQRAMPAPIARPESRRPAETGPRIPRASDR